MFKTTTASDLPAQADPFEKKKILKYNFYINLHVGVNNIASSGVNVEGEGKCFIVLSTHSVPGNVLDII